MSEKIDTTSKEARQKMNPYETPKTIAFESPEPIIVPVDDEVAREETAVMKWAGRGSYISVIVSFLLGFFFLSGALSFIWVMIPLGTLGLSAIVYVFASAFEGWKSPEE